MFFSPFLFKNGAMTARLDATKKITTRMEQCEQGLNLKQGAKHGRGIAH